MARVVQFFHSANEYDVPRRCYRGENTPIGWNTTGAHFRRFLSSEGNYINEQGDKERGDLLFWSEWEANTLVTELPHANDSGCAKWLHVPQIPISTQIVGACGLQNTDPCVFGASFKYALCLQEWSSELRNLERGSLIIFGGRKNFKFCLDTVFVVDEKTLYNGPDAEQKVSCSKDYRILTLNQTRGKLSFYRGVTWEQRHDFGGIYSFVPGICLDGRVSLNTLSPESRKRCVLDLRRLKHIMGNGEARIFDDGKKTQGFSSIEASQSLIKQIWDELLRQSIENGFVPCVHFPWPQVN